VDIFKKRIQGNKKQDMKRRTAFTAMLLILATTALVAKPQFGKADLFNHNWRFALTDTKEGANPALNDSKWRTLDIPHDWSIEGTYSPDKASCTGYLPGGIGWYRKSFTIDEDKRGQKVYVYFEGIYNRSEVYINGHLVGKRPNGYISFMYDLTPHINYDKPNTIAVRVDHSQSADSRWYSGSGIYRDVYLVYANPLHINNWGIYAYPSMAEKEKGILQVEVELKNELAQAKNVTITNELVSPYGDIKAKSKGNIKVITSGTATYKTSLNVPNPNLWSIDNPSLYKLVTKVYIDGKLIDESTTTTGFRKFTFDPNKGFALNNQWMKVKGVCLHHDAGVLGAAMYREVWKRRLLTLKELGTNAIRTSHNPQASSFYELCDELGILVLNEAYDEWEFPKRKWLEGWNVGAPGFQGSYDFFEEWGEKDLEDMVKRDRNHLSVFAWSIGNEVDYPNDPYSHPVLDGGKDTGFTQAIYGGFRKDAPDAMRLGAIAQKLAAAVRKYDTSRPVTAGLAGVTMSNQTDYPGALDIAGYNYTEKLYDEDHKKYPNRIIYGSENRHDIEAWKYVTDREFIFGQFLWTGIDYLGESGRWPSRGFYSGLIDFAGFIKPRGYFRQSLWSDKPMTYIGTYPVRASKAGSVNADVLSQLEAQEGNEPPRLSMDAWPVWNYTDNQLIRVVVYTNAAKTRLLLNGNQVGEPKAYNPKTGIIHWDIPFQAGKLEAEGYDNSGKRIVVHAIHTTGQPTELRAQLINNAVDAHTGLAQITLKAFDSNGLPVVLADNMITCTINGPAKLIGLEAGNNHDMTDYNDNSHRLYHGQMIAYIRPTGQDGTVTVKFSSPWLKKAEVQITIAQNK
jgi:beta-galactosidase